MHIHVCVLDRKSELIWINIEFFMNFKKLDKQFTICKASLILYFLVIADLAY